MFILCGSLSPSHSNISHFSLGVLMSNTPKMSKTSSEVNKGYSDFSHVEIRGQDPGLVLFLFLF